jgi:hypothetical protein
MEKAGKALIVIGVCVVVAGIVVWLLGDKLRFLGRLPGDIRYESANTKVYIPITTMILISVLLSIVLWIIRRLS